VAAPAAASRIAIGSDRLAVASPDNVARVIELPSGRILAEYRGHGDFLTGVAFVDDAGGVVTSSNDGSVREWRSTPAGGERRLRAHDARVAAACFSASGDHLFSAAPAGPVREWDVATGRLARSVATGAGVESLAASADGSWIAAGLVDGSVLRFDARTGEIAARTIVAKEPVIAIGFDGAGASLVAAAADGSLTRTTVATGGVTALVAAGAATVAAAVDREAGLVAMAPQGGGVVVFDLARGTRVEVEGRPALVRCLRFDHQGGRLAIGTAEDSADLWSVPDGRFLGKGALHADDVEDVAFHPDGSRLATASSDGSVGLWAPGRASPLGLFRARGGAVMRIAFSPDGSILAAGQADGTLVLRDTVPSADRLTR
jgi:WD40 repeat protein